MNARASRGTAFAALIFLAVQLGALALVPTFYDQGYQTVQNPQDPTNSLAYLGAILVATAFMLAAFKFDLDVLVRGVIVFSSALLSWYVFGAVLPWDALALGLAGLVALALLVHPEWYVIDAAGVLMGAGAAGLFGISFGVLPALVLLAVLAVYDAISVYGTEHMLELAEGVMDLRVPVVLVIPLTLSYSLLDEDFSAVGDRGDEDGAGDGTADETEAVADAGATADGSVADPSRANGGDRGGDANRTESAEIAADESTAADDEETKADEEAEGERDAFFIGLGDAVMPTILVASGAFFLDAAPSLGVPGLAALNLPALGAMVGTFLGLFVLLRMVFAGRAHAGLPLLNGGAIGGYLLGAVLAGVPLVEALGLTG